MRRFAKKLAKWTTDMLDLPQDVIFDLPRITMIGPLQMYVENHRGVLVFSDQEVRILLSNQGQLLVRGSQFILRKILPEEVLLEGRIREVKYIEPEKIDGG